MTAEEHTPAPQESRGIYGFVLFVMMNILTLIYFIWMLMPSEWIQSLPYEPPQVYWGLAVPVYFCTNLFLFAFVIYPSLHGLHDAELDDKSAFTDPYSLPLNYFEEQRAKGKLTYESKIQDRFHRRWKGSSQWDHSKSKTWSKDKKSFDNPILQSMEEEQQEISFGPNACKPIPPVSDMDLNSVCQILYGEPKSNL